ncbi:MAG: RtcB family protein [Deltaproteobacteria bacterium]|nr:RtcB family protein [Deltaproteobacteria bacterium]
MSTLQIKGIELKETIPGIWRIEPFGSMRVGVHLVASENILQKIKDDKSIDQALNVATLPGVTDPVLTMPDIHQGYGFPIGGVAAFQLHDGVVSPGGVGYDINCGVRLLKTPLFREEIHEREKMRQLVIELFNNVPSGVGSRRKDLRVTSDDLADVLKKGARWAVSRGFGYADDCQFIEENGQLPNADPDEVSDRAKERGEGQLGTLGSGNHFLEIEYVDEIFDPNAAATFGLVKDQIVVSIHTGSRGLGYQVCSDYLDIVLQAARKYKIELKDRELAAAPLSSEEGKRYLAAMASAANFAFANRQIITHWVRETFSRHFGPIQMPLLYDVCHNIAKFEKLQIGKKLREVCVHRKGATRAYPPRHPLIPQPYTDIGQPILIPGDMGRYSYLLVGKEGAMERSLGSACHGAGRELSRHQAKRLAKGRAISRELEDRGIYVKAAGRDTILEEMPEAYKDVTDVVKATEHAGIAAAVARLKPIGVVKG